MIKVIILEGQGDTDIMIVDDEVFNWVISEPNWNGQQSVMDENIPDCVKESWAVDKYHPQPDFTFIVPMNLAAVVFTVWADAVKHKSVIDFSIK